MNTRWYKKITHWSVTLIGILGSFSAHAGLFTPPPSDESVQILGTIFGPNIGNIPLGGNANPALNSMFEILNVITFSLGTVIVTYIAVVSLINTAQEGKTMGKKWAGIWIPMRSLLGMLLLVPTPGAGYSLIQTAVMWLVMNGIGAADKVWNVVLDNFLENHGPLTGVYYDAPSNQPMLPLTRNQAQITEMRAHAEHLTEQLLNSATCAASFSKIVEHARRENRQWISQSVIDASHHLRIYHIDSPRVTDTPFGAVVAGGIYIGIKGNPNLYNMCGQYDISAKVYRNEWPHNLQHLATTEAMRQKAREIYNHKVTAINLIYSSIAHAATELVKGNAITLGYKDLAKNIYVNSLASVTIPVEVSADLAEKIEHGKRAGWVSAGPFYAYLNKANKSDLFQTVTDPNEIEADNVPSCNSPHCTDPADIANNAFLASLDTALGYAEEKFFIKKALYQSSQFFAQDNHTFKQDMGNNEIFENAFMRDMQAHINNDRTGIFQKLVNALTNEKDGIINATEMMGLMERLKRSEQDPLYLLGQFGNQILGATEKNLLESIKDPNKFIEKIRTILRANNDQELMDIKNNMFLTTLTLGFFLALWGAGATLALYIPFIPFMIFTVTSIGWLILVVEAIVAAPLLALSFVLPSGDELGKVAQGLMILLNILLRPTLIIFGFVLASRVFKAVFTFVHYGISMYMSNIDYSSTILSTLALLIMYIVFIVSLTNKSFALIYVIPDKILRWIGGGPEQTDISQETQMTKGSLQRTGDVTQKLASYGTVEELNTLRRHMDQHANVPTPEQRNNE